MNKTPIQTAAAPGAIGPFAQASAAGAYVFCSGQIALGPATGRLVDDDIGAQTHRVLQNLQAVLAVAGSGPDQVVKTSVFLTDFRDFTAMNEVYAGYFATPAPARTTVGVGTLPRDARVEIECIALRAQS